MDGFFQRVLFVDLCGRTSRLEELPDSVLAATLGGKGLGTYLLQRDNPPGVDALGPENRFILTTGPLSDTTVWGHARFGICTKGPATQGFLESYCGGRGAAVMKGCGVDAIVLEGASPSAVYLSFDSDGVQFHDAGALWGMETFDAEAAMLASAPRNAVALTIGPAGENRAAIASIKVERWRSLGRGGCGAVLGAKNVKGMVFCGRLRCRTADPERLTALNRRISALSKQNPVTQLYRSQGTPMQVKITNSHGCFPTRYWTAGRFEHWQNLSAEYMAANFDVRAAGCPHCFLRCTKHTVVRNGRHAGLEIEGPEYETIYALGGINALDCLEEVVWLNDLCDRLGIDTMSAGNLAGFAVEAYERGRSDFAIAFNQPDRMAELFRMIARREGIGALLADGIKSAAAELGLEDVAVHVKGLEPAGFDPRVLKGMGLSYATSARGACHLRGTFYKAELSGQVEKEMISGKAAHVIDFEDRAAVSDCLILCRFFRDFYLWDELSELVAAATGLEYDTRTLQRFANGVTQATRAFNRREGIGPQSDTLPRRFFSAPTAEGVALSEEQFDLMLDEYNDLRSRNGRLDGQAILGV
ncbi:MAG: aldehyde:ferredoxin oxidoreductase [Spirochaetaceae bacterium]|nr:MAG: aldehyde:ferredoxin oxidoreductase [Spirochaetaceae bacterium]